MGFFDTLGETLASTSKVVGSKTKEMAGTTKLSLQISQEEAKLKKAYEALGEAYFKNHENDMPEPYAVYAADIRECAARLESLTKDKQILKNQKRCASCGAWMPKSLQKKRNPGKVKRQKIPKCKNDVGTTEEVRNH